MSILISNITTDDIDFMKDLELENNLSPWSIKDYLDEVNRKNSIALILSKDQQKCGFIIGRVQKSVDITEAEIYNLAVKKAFQNKNFGTKLLEEFINRGKKFNLNKIFLEVRKSNQKAINFYRKNNFLEIGRRPKFYINPVEDAVSMCRSISL